MPNNPVASLVKVAVSHRRQQFLIGRQGSSGEELTPGSEPETPRHVMQFSRRLMDHEEEQISLDIPQKMLAQSNNNDPASKNETVILELEEQMNVGGCTETRSAAVFQVWKIFIPGLNISFMQSDSGGQVNVLEGKGYYR
jgi:hypothetical protein